MAKSIPVSKLDNIFKLFGYSVFYMRNKNMQFKFNIKLKNLVSYVYISAYLKFKRYLKTNIRFEGED